MRIGCAAEIRRTSQHHFGLRRPRGFESSRHARTYGSDVPGIWRADRYTPGCREHGPARTALRIGILGLAQIAEHPGSAVRFDLYRRVCPGKGRSSRRAARDHPLELGTRTCPRPPTHRRRSPPIYVRDGSCYTSAGVTAGIDLCLALVEEDFGRPLALRIAQMMVVFLRRPGGQSQFSATLEAQTRESRPLGDLLAWLPDHLRHDLSIDSLARRATMSTRTFARLFKQELEKTPGRHIEDLRLEAARRRWNQRHGARMKSLMRAG